MIIALRRAEQYYWFEAIENEAPVAVSPNYPTELEARRALDEFKVAAASAEVVDLTV